MRYFKDDKTSKAFAIPDELEFYIRYDWIEILESEYEIFIEESKVEISEVSTQVGISEARLNEVMDRLMEIDVESIRPLRSIAIHKDVLLDHQKLKSLHEERQNLLIELKQGSKP